MPPRCPRCHVAATGPALHGTPMVLCPVCWTVVAPEPPPAPIERPVEDELATLPYRPTPRMGPVFTPRFFLGLAFFAAAAAAGTVGWSVRKANPRLTEHTSPGGGYTAAFPDQPRWFVESSGLEGGMIPSGRAERDTGFWPEYYQVRAVWLGRTRSGPRGPPELIALTWAPGARPAQAPRGHAAAEFEGWDEVARARRVGRVLVVKDFAYELTVTGRGVSLSDRRVRRFFNSFRIGR
jgi:hypothetical protein